MENSHYDYEKIAIKSLDEGVKKSVDCHFQWQWAYHLGKAIVYALLCIAQVIKEK